jgi:hypothetical protein
MSVVLMSSPVDSMDSLGGADAVELSNLSMQHICREEMISTNRLQLGLASGSRSWVGCVALGPARYGTAFGWLLPCEECALVGKWGHSSACLLHYRPGLLYMGAV